MYVVKKLNPAATFRLYLAGVKNYNVRLYYRLRRFTYFKIVIWAFCISVASWMIVTAFSYSQNFIAIRLPDPLGEIPLAYHAVLFTIMIPIYLLVTQQQIGIKSIGSRAILGYIQFREITILLILSTVATFIFSNTHALSYLYVSLIVSTLLVLYALHRVFAILFQTTPLKQIVEWMINDAVEQHVFELRRQRIDRNKQYELIKTSETIDYLHVSVSEQADFAAYEVRLPRLGIVTSIDIDKIEAGLQRLNRLHKKKSPPLRQIKSNSVPSELDIKNTQPLFRFEIHKLPYDELRTTSIVGKLICPEITASDDRDKAIAIIKQHVRIDEPRNTLQWINDWLDDTEETIYSALSSENISTLNRALEWYQILLDATDRAMTRHMKDDNYDMKAAEAELHSWGADFLSKEQSRIFEIIDDAMRSSLLNSKKDASKTLIGFIYKNVLSSYRSDNVTAIVRAERWFSNTLGVCLYNQADVSIDMCDYITSRFVEHSGLMLYDAKDKKMRHDTNSQEVSNELLQRRLADVRQGVLVAAKNKNTVLFKALSGILQNHAYQAYMSRRTNGLPQHIQHTVDNSLVLIIAYLRKKNLTAEAPYSSFARDVQDKWQFEYASERIIQCFDDNLADSWRVDSIDLIADGQMHSVHSYTDDLRELWVRLAEKHHVDSASIRSFIPVEILEKTDFFTGGLSAAKNSPFYSLPSHEKFSEQLRSAIDTSCKIRITAEQEMLATIPLDQSKVDAFRQKAEASYTEYVVLQMLVHDDHRSIAKPHKQKGFKQFGINTIFDKEAFTDWHRGYYIDHNAEELGQQSASVEDDTVLQEIAQERGIYVNTDSLSSTLNEVGGEWTVIANNIDQWDLGHNYAELYDDTKSDNTGNSWYVKNVQQNTPVRQIYSDSNKKQLLYFVKPETLGNFEYLSNDTGFMDVTVTALSHDTAALDTLITEQPKWLKDKGKDEVAQRRYLRAKVILKVMHTFRYEPSGKETIVVCDLSPK